MMIPLRKSGWPVHELVGLARLMQSRAPSGSVSRTARSLNVCISWSWIETGVLNPVWLSYRRVRQHRYFRVIDDELAEATSKER